MEQAKGKASNSDTKSNEKTAPNKKGRLHTKKVGIPAERASTHNSRPQDGEKNTSKRKGKYVSSNPKANRFRRQQIAEETLSIMKNKSYTVDYGSTTVSLATSLDAACESTVLYKPNDNIQNANKTIFSVEGKILKSIDNGSSAVAEVPTILVSNCGCISAAKALVEQKDFQNIGMLNFASAKNPGGGFLNGSLAQEESICLCSGLYSCINQKTVFEMYDHNRKGPGDGLYSDHMSFAPRVPVFRNDVSYELESEPYFISFITAPAVNRSTPPWVAGKILQKGGDNAMIHRMERVLQVAMAHRCDALVLGAFGCGVFRNEPKDVARWWKELLSRRPYKSSFRHVSFAVLDRPNGRTIKAFEDRFQALK